MALSNIFTKKIRPQIKDYFGRKKTLILDLTERSLAYKTTPDNEKNIEIMKSVIRESAKEYCPDCKIEWDKIDNIIESILK